MERQGIALWTNRVTWYAQARKQLRVDVHMSRVVPCSCAFPTHPLFPILPAVVTNAHKSFQIVRQVVLKVSKLSSCFVEKILHSRRVADELRGNGKRARQVKDTGETWQSDWTGKLRKFMARSTQDSTLKDIQSDLNWVAFQDTEKRFYELQQTVSKISKIRQTDRQCWLFYSGACRKRRRRERHRTKLLNHQNVAQIWRLQYTPLSEKESEVRAWRSEHTS